jgi:hypothetical protein
MKHRLDCSEIDEPDEIDEDCQMALIWCLTHRKYESHSIPRRLIGRDHILEVETRESGAI